MANGTAPDEFVVLSRVRTGLKREFAFALKVQSEICGLLALTNARRLNNVIPESPTPKRLKGLATTEANGGEEDDEKSSEAAQLRRCEEGDVEKVKTMEDTADSMSEEEAKSDIVDLVSDEEPRSQVDESMGDTSNAICMAESKEELLDSEDPNSHEKSKETLRIEPEELLTSGDSGKDGKNVPPEEAGNGSESIVVVKGQLGKKMAHQPRKRFTRSTLKQNSEPTTTSTEILAKSDVGTAMQAIPNDSETKPEKIPSPLATPTMKIGKTKLNKVSAKKFPAKLKDLLETGILEGLRVRYIRGSKVMVSVNI